MTGRLMLAAGMVLCAVAVFADPPVSAAWLPGVLLVVGGWHREITAPARAARRRRAARRGWLHG